MVETEPMPSIFRADRAAVVERLAIEQGIPFHKRVPGESYVKFGGETGVLPEGLIIIDLDIEPGRDMKPFWARVNEVDTSGHTFKAPLDTSRSMSVVSAVEKAGRELGPGYMLDPENDAALAVADDSEHALRDIRTEPSPLESIASRGEDYE